MVIIDHPTFIAIDWETIVKKNNFYNRFFLEVVHEITSHLFEQANIKRKPSKRLNMLTA